MSSFLHVGVHFFIIRCEVESSGSAAGAGNFRSIPHTAQLLLKDESIEDRSVALFANKRASREN